MKGATNSHPLVSVIIPLYNAEKYIEQCINSVRSQSYTNLEIIVVNDGSVDNGAAIVKKNAEADFRIHLYHQRNKGQCAASNFGFSKSKGKYIKFFDADDILSHGCIEKQVASLSGQDEFSISYMNYVRFYNDDLSTANFEKAPALINYNCTPLEYITFHGSPQMYQCAMWLFDRKIFQYSGLWDERLSLINDTEFFPRILMYAKRLYYTPQEKLYYRTNFNSGSLSQTVSEKSMRSAVMSIDLMAKHYRSIETSERIEKLIAQSYSEILEMSYPSQLKWTHIIERRLKHFHKKQYSFRKSGIFYNIISMVFGWKLAKRLQTIYYRIRYK